MLTNEQVSAVVDKGGGSLRLAAHKAGVGRIEVEDVIRLRAEKKARDEARSAILRGEVRAAAPVVTAAAPVQPRGSIAAQVDSRTEPQVAAITQWDVTFARESASQSATTRERERWAKVFASEHSKGRERVCVTLLSTPKGWSADAILAELPTLPTDQQQAGGTPAAMAAADASWDRAYGVAAASRSTVPAAAPATTAGDDAWARAYGLAQATSTPSKSTTTTRSADDVWARCYGSDAR